MHPHHTLLVLHFRKFDMNAVFSEFLAYVESESAI